MRKPPPIRNRRVSNTRQRKQQHLLEVTVRRDIARKQQTRKVLGVTCRIVLSVGLILGAFFAGKEGLRRFLWENPDYYLTDVRVPADGALTREQILAAAQIVEGRNIFEIDLARARAGLDALPQVDRVEVQRVLPNRINIQIAERRPIAWVAARADEDPSVSEKAFLIDARGVVMRSKTMLPEYLLLPVISGAPVENYAPGQVVKTLEMQAALDLIRLNADSTFFQIRNIDISKGYCLVVTDRNHVHATFGLDAVDQQQARLNRILERTQLLQREVQTVNLLVERNTPVTFAEPAHSFPNAATAPAATSAAETSKEKSFSTKEKAPEPARPPNGARNEMPPPVATPVPTATAAARRGSTSSSSARKTPAGTRKPFRP
jgi:cell division septal protein FtsQ